MYRSILEVDKEMSKRWIILRSLGIYTVLGMILLIIHINGLAMQDEGRQSFVAEKPLLTPSKIEIYTLTNAFMDILMQETNKGNKLIHYQTKDELAADYQSIISVEAARPYIDIYFKEKPDGLYLNLREGPPWFSKNNRYDMVQLNEKKVKVIQKNYMDLYGEYTIVIQLTYEKDWKITKIKYV